MFLINNIDFISLDSSTIFMQYLTGILVLLSSLKCKLNISSIYKN